MVSLGNATCECPSTCFELSVPALFANCTCLSTNFIKRLNAVMVNQVCSKMASTSRF